MNNPRTFLLVALFALVYLIYSQWQIDYNPQVATPVQATSLAEDASAGLPVAQTNPSTSGEIPQASATAAVATAAVVPPSATMNVSTDPIVVTTDLLRVEIDPRGGSVISADLLAYPMHQNQAERVRLLDPSVEHFFVAQTGLVSVGSPAPNHEAMFDTVARTYTLADGQNRLEVPLTWTDPSGVSVTKTFVFERGSYVIEQQQRVDNQSAAIWTGNAYRQMQRVPHLVDSSGIKGYTNTERYSFNGAAWYSPEEKFQKLAFDKFSKEPLDRSVTGGWVGLLQHYFFAAWIPPPTETDRFTTSEIATAPTRYLVRSQSSTLTIEPGTAQTFDARLYVGPKLQSTLDDIAPGLAKTADYGIFTVISEPLHWLLSMYHKLTGNWGFAIILLVLSIKAVFFKLSEAQQAVSGLEYRAFAGVRNDGSAAVQREYRDVALAQPRVSERGTHEVGVGEHRELCDALPGRMVGLLHGRMAAAEKAAVMQLFSAGAIAVLVATTVIEVGVDVPNASLMVIEHAERFGLSQLHQLRGRVGRGTVASVCVLLYAAPLSDPAKARLKAMLETTDGFEIARRDLEIRGPGEFLGARQSGSALLRFADLAEDTALVEAARRAALLLLDRHQEAAAAHLQRWLGGKSEYLKA